MSDRIDRIDWCTFFVQVLIFIGETGLCFNWAIVTDILLVRLTTLNEFELTLIDQISDDACVVSRALV